MVVPLQGPGCPCFGATCGKRSDRLLVWHVGRSAARETQTTTHTHTHTNTPCSRFSTRLTFMQSYVSRCHLAQGPSCHKPSQASPPCMPRWFCHCQRAFQACLQSIPAGPTVIIVPATPESNFISSDNRSHGSDTLHQEFSSLTI